jgi:hypothetical protein
VVAIDLVIFLAAGQFDRFGIDDHDVIAGIDERGVGGLVLPLSSRAASGGHATDSLARKQSMTCQRLSMVFGVATYVRMRIGPYASLADDGKPK